MSSAENPACCRAIARSAVTSAQKAVEKRQRSIGKQYRSIVVSLYSSHAELRRIAFKCYKPQASGIWKVCKRYASESLIQMLHENQATKRRGDGLRVCPGSRSRMSKFEKGVPFMSRMNLARSVALSLLA